jgi:predicted glycoside hydrolase/deacetylase ChbG (UPF0249 family)
VADRPLLIVNADDFGLRADVTGAILDCWAARGVSSTTAMVHMADSRRAAELAQEHRPPVGLHLNLTTRYSDPGVPPAVAARQARLVEHFTVRRRRWLPAPRVRALVADCIADQLEEFERLYGRPPTHVDGHEHIQGCPAVFLSRGLRRAPALRLTHTFAPAERPVVHRVARGAINAAIRGRFRTTGRFWSLRDLHPALGGSGLDRALDGTAASVEVMVHPAYPDEREVLLSPEWADALAERRLGSYADLAKVA